MAPIEKTDSLYSYSLFTANPQSRGDSMKRLTAIAEEYATKHGLRLDRSSNSLDLGRSAFGSKHSEAFAGFLRAINAGEIAPGSTLLYDSPDRFPRDQVPNAVAEFMEILNKGITVVCRSPDIAFSRRAYDADPVGMTMLLVLSLVR